MSAGANNVRNGIAIDPSSCFGRARKNSFSACVIINEILAGMRFHQTKHAQSRKFEILYRFYPDQPVAREPSENIVIELHVRPPTLKWDLSPIG
jgi:hypothetical protein